MAFGPDSPALKTLIARLGRGTRLYVELNNAIISTESGAIYSQKFPLIGCITLSTQSFICSSYTVHDWDFLAFAWLAGWLR